LALFVKATITYKTLCAQGGSRPLPTAGFGGLGGAQ